MKISEIKELLDEKADQYNRLDFIETDPIQIPHLFTRKKDAEIAGFLTATIAWGQRVTIIHNAKRLLDIMDGAPYDFIIDATTLDLDRLDRFVHRTFNGVDAKTFVLSLRHLYRNHGGLEGAFTEGFQKGSAADAIVYVRNLFFTPDHPQRTEKHFSNPHKGSSAKRLNMYLRWMVRSDEREVDLGLWKSISPSLLDLPLDVHTGNVSRSLGLLKRKQNDYKSVAEIMKRLRKFNPEDPVIYDYALFGLGVFEGVGKK
jgi:uncharacterized protein (TIGR02757 family)